VTDEFPAGGESMMVQGQDGTWRLTGAALQEHDDGTFTLRPTGPWTRHGQPVPGISPPGVGPEAIDCGGIAHCSTCRRDATRIRDAHRNQTPAPPDIYRLQTAVEALRYDRDRGVLQTLVDDVVREEIEVRTQLAEEMLRAVVIAELRRLGYTITAP
jgi:hypothetical protein